MGVPTRRRVLLSLAVLLLPAAIAPPSRADEIRLKDGKKLNGVIVAYEDNMFKVKTDFGYVLVEKDKIASIIPDTPDQAPAKANPRPSPKSQPPVKPTHELPAASRHEDPATSDGDGNPAAPGSHEKSMAIAGNANARPAIPAAKATSASASAPALKPTAEPPKPALAASAAIPPPPKEEPPANRDEIQGNLYINHTFGFRMYKAPSWQLIDGAGQSLPNAIVAMGTPTESTLLVVGREKTKAPLETAAQTVEKRLHDVYENYRLLSQRKTVVAGLPAVEYHYRGLADEHDWSGALAVVARGNDIFTVLGMTYGDSDLIQIQENVIARAIASLDFTAR